MQSVNPGLDRWEASFVPELVGQHDFRIRAWIDERATWRDDVARKVDAGVDEPVDHLGEPPARFPAAAAETSPPVPVVVELGSRPVLHLVRAVPPVGGSRAGSRHAGRRDRAARRPGRPRLRRRVPATRPPDRHVVPQGPEQRRAGRRRRPRQSVGHRLAARAATPRSIPSWERWTTSTRWSTPRRDREMEVALDLAFQCSPDHPWVARAPRVVPAPARRDDPVRGEPAQAVPGHLPARLRVERLAGFVGRAARGDHVLVRARRAHLPCRQPAHQAVRVLGMAARRGGAPPPGHDLPVRGVHPAGTHAPPGADRLHAELHLLPLADLARRAGRLLHRAEHAPERRRATAERVAQHAGHPAVAPPARAAVGVRRAIGAGGHPVAQLRRLRTGLRARRQRAGRQRQGGVPRLREVRDSAMGARRTPQPPAVARRDQRHPSRPPGLPHTAHPAVPRL